MIMTRSLVFFLKIDLLCKILAELMPSRCLKLLVIVVKKLNFSELSDFTNYLSDIKAFGKQVGDLLYFLKKEQENRAIAQIDGVDPSKLLAAYHLYSKSKNTEFLDKIVKFAMRNERKFKSTPEVLFAIYADLGETKKLLECCPTQLKTNQRELIKAYSLLNPFAPTQYGANIYNWETLETKKFKSLAPKERKFLIDRFYKEGKYMSFLGGCLLIDVKNLDTKHRNRYTETLLRYGLYSRAKVVSESFETAEYVAELLKSKFEAFTNVLRAHETTHLTGETLAEIGRQIVESESTLPNFFDFKFDKKVHDKETLMLVDTPISIKTILVGLGMGIGNSLQVTPVVKFLSKHFDVKVDLLIEDRYNFLAEILQKNEYVSKIISASEYSFEPYDFVFVTASFIQPPPVINSPRTVYSKRFGDMYHETQKFHEAEFYFEILKRVGIISQYSRDDFSSYFIENCNTHPIEKKGQIIGIHAGCKPGIWDKKKWPYFSELTVELKRHGYDVLSVGSENEYVEGTKNYCGLKIEDTVSVISQCDGFISNDSGIMHIADALNIPLLALFGPSSVSKNGPLSNASETMTSELYCSPCQFSKRIAYCSSNKCLQQLSITAVANRLKSMVRKTF